MSARVLPSTAAVDMKTNAATERIRVADLVNGRELRHPLYDDDGLLLLAEGSLITARFKELLVRRGFESVQAHRDDVENLTGDGGAGRGSTAPLRLDTELTRQLDRLIDSGTFEGPSDGPPVRNRLASHGTKPWHGAQRASLLQKHDESCELLRSLMLAAVGARTVSARPVVNLASAYAGELTSDVDTTLSVASELEPVDAFSAHSLSLAILGMAIGIEMGFDERSVCLIGTSGMVHDWGMQHVPVHIREADRMLTASEFVEITKHPAHTVEILARTAGFPKLVPLICYQVHESPNGTGYPRGRQGDSIHPFARILKVADAYIGMTSIRPHRPAMMPYAAMECVLRQAQARTVDADAARALLHVLTLFPIGSYVALSDGSVARVIRRSGDAYTTPVVQVQNEPLEGGGRHPNAGAIVDLARSSLKITKALPTPGRDEMALRPEYLSPRR